MSSDWAGLIITVVTVLGGISYWGGRLARALEGIERAMEKMVQRQDETEKHVTAHDSRIARLEAFQEISQ